MALEERLRHLGASRVVSADEEHVFHRFLLPRKAEPAAALAAAGFGME